MMLPGSSSGSGEGETKVRWLATRRAPEMMMSFPMRDGRRARCPLGTGRQLLLRLPAVETGTDLDLERSSHDGRERGGLRSEEATAGLRRMKLVLLGRGMGATNSNARRLTCRTWLLRSRQP